MPLSILAFNFISIIILFCTACPTKGRRQHTSKKEKACADPSKRKGNTITQAPPTDAEVGSGAQQTHLNSSKKNGQNIHSGNSPHVDTDGNQHPVSTERSDQTDKEYKKENIDEAIKNNLDDITKIHTEIERMKHTIAHLEKVIEICTHHKHAFYKWRFIINNRVLFHLHQTGLTPIQIEHIQSKEDAEKYLQAAKEELKANEVTFEKAQEKQRTLTIEYGNL